MSEVTMEYCAGESEADARDWLRGAQVGSRDTCFDLRQLEITEREFGLSRADWVQPGDVSR